MTNSSSLEERSLVLGWLAHGSELAFDLKGDRAKHSDVIWQLIKRDIFEAFRKALNLKVRAFL